MTYVKTYLPTLKTHVVNLKRDAKDLSRDLQRLEVRGKLGSKTLYCSDPREKPTAADLSAFGQHRKFPPRARKTSGTQGNDVHLSDSKRCITGDCRL